MSIDDEPATDEKLLAVEYSTKWWVSSLGGLALSVKEPPILSVSVDWSVKDRPEGAVGVSKGSSSSKIEPCNMKLYITYHPSIMYVPAAVQINVDAVPGSTSKAVPLYKVVVVSRMIVPPLAGRAYRLLAVD